MTADVEVLKALVGGVDFDPDALRARYDAERDKRLRPGGDQQYIATAKQFSSYVEDPYVAPGFTRAPLCDEVGAIIVGGGFGGMLMGARLRGAGIERIRYIEKAGDFGGTWYWNRYPGAACDVESYVYLPLLEETGYVPRHKYSFAPEILDYSRRFARHFDLYRDACFQTSVTDMRWDEAARRWHVETDRGDRMRAQFVIVSSGALDRPKLPGIPGIETFAGHTFHTSRWDYDYTGGSADGGLDRIGDKAIGIVGTGATAIQCVPHLAAGAGHLHVFQRTPSSVDARNNRETDPAWAASLRAGWQAERMNNFVTIIHGGDADVDLVDDGWTDMFTDITGAAAKRRAAALGRPLTRIEQRAMTELADFKKMEKIRRRVDAVVGEGATAEALKPWYRQFCKRPCFNDGYLEAFTRPNVTLVDTDGHGIERVTPGGVIVGGREIALDCLIFATGFETNSAFVKRTGFDVAGRDGIRLSDHWRRGVRTLHGLQSHGFPNIFFMGSTQTAFTFLVPFSLGQQASQIAHIIGEVGARGAEVIEATAAGETGWCDEMAAKAHLSDAFYASCTPGYYNDEGNLQNPFGVRASTYGGGPMRFLEILAAWREAGDMAGTELR
ncbi:flavin-containing monooxygenase [Sphingomonas profundi]|uniref:flavin-containing monooxygenase n=1 Tax=Alterirhizorhabdus profundi TaxID=2681549 RepID=UPI0012E96298|nr:NAD(P)/FAD-dependent oxidoreductase [Sphingomonas profundi]